MSTNHALLLVDIFLHSYAAKFIVFFPDWKEKSSQFNFTYRYSNDVLSINNPDFENYLDQMYPV